MFKAFNQVNYQTQNNFEYVYICLIRLIYVSKIFYLYGYMIFVVIQQNKDAALKIKFFSLKKKKKKNPRCFSLRPGPISSRVLIRWCFAFCRIWATRCGPRTRTRPTGWAASTGGPTRTWCCTTVWWPTRSWETRRSRPNTRTAPHTGPGNRWTTSRSVSHVPRAHRLHNNKQ